MALFGLAVGGIVLWSQGEFVQAVFLPPVLVHLALPVLFGRPLLPGKVPMITAIFTLMRGEPEPHVARYTRRATEVWVIFFSLMTVETVLLAVYAPVQVGFLLSNLLNYMMMSVLMIVDYQVRRRVFRAAPCPGVRPALLAVLSDTAVTAPGSAGATTVPGPYPWGGRLPERRSGGSLRAPRKNPPLPEPPLE